MLQSKNIKFPHVCIKNMTARRYLCWHFRHYASQRKNDPMSG
jgi:hypothetical protein